MNHRSRVAAVTIALIAVAMLMVLGFTNRPSVELAMPPPNESLTVTIELPWAAWFGWVSSRVEDYYRGYAVGELDNRERGWSFGM